MALYNKRNNKWINWYISNPLKTWWKAHEYFKFPKLKVSFTTIEHNCPFMCYGNVSRILEIRIMDVGWKDKWDSPRHERNPYFWICLFRKWVFAINTRPFYFVDESGRKHDLDMQYWERMLRFLYYKKTLISSYWLYTSEIDLNKDGKPKMYPIIESSYLTDKGLERLRYEVVDIIKKRSDKNISELEN